MSLRHKPDDMSDRYWVGMWKIYRKELAQLSTEQMLDTLVEEAQIRFNLEFP